MTETSYTAWDDKLYQWPPPEGWYLATDGKWWPEGYGPEPAPVTDAAPSATTGDPTAASAAVGGADAAATGAASRELDSLTDSVSGWAETTAADRPVVEGELPGSVAGVGDLVDPGTGSLADRADSLLAGSGRAAAEAAASEVADSTSAAAATGASAVTDHMTSIAGGADGGRRRELPGSDDVAAALAETLGTRDGAEGPAAGDPGEPKGRTGSVEERAVAAVVDSAQAGAAEREIGADPGDRVAGVTEAARGIADSTVDHAGSTLDQVAGADRSTFDDATQSLTGGLTPPVQLPLEQPPSTRPPIDTPTGSSSVDLDSLPPPSFEPPTGPPLDAGPAVAGLGIDSPPPERLPRAEGLAGPGDTIGDAPSAFAGPSPEETMVVPDTTGPDDAPGRAIGVGSGGVVDESVVTSAFNADPGTPGPTPASPPPAAERARHPVRCGPTRGFPVPPVARPVPVRRRPAPRGARGASLVRPRRPSTSIVRSWPATRSPASPEPCSWSASGSSPCWRSASWPSPSCRAATTSPTRRPRSPGRVRWPSPTRARPPWRSSIRPATASVGG